MPYIKQEDRIVYEKELSALIDKLVDYFSKEPTQIVNNRAGHLNYLITSLINRFYTRLTKKLGLKIRYSDYNEIVGFLESCKLEFYRRQIAAYEDKKTQESGDVFNI